MDIRHRPSMRVPSGRKVLVAIEGKIARGNGTATMRCQPLSLRT